ncbi:MAG: NAD-dependent epimerase/dehydratase family protein [Betaproteobacteria bacterium]|nr:NAD-dependent epimerase/dehydratase family protein [Betaproteobacteria bacterium]
MLVVITGATGFIGRSVCTRFAAAGWKIRGIARNISAQGMKDVELHSLDLEAADALPSLRGAELVIHLAGRAHMLEEKFDDLRAAFQSANSNATVHLAQAAARAGVRRFIFASTAKVHGEESPGRPFTEHDAPNPQDDYARSKWNAEQRLRHILPDSIVLRPPLVFGPGVGANFLRLMRLVERGIPLPLASVRNSRSLVSVQNLADCIMACATHKDAPGKTFLVSDGEDVSTPQLLRMLGAHLGFPAMLWPCPPAVLRLGASLLGRRAEADRLLGSLEIDSNAVRAMGWAPSLTLDEGLRQTVSWYRSAKSRQPKTDDRQAVD